MKIYNRFPLALILTLLLCPLAVAADVVIENSGNITDTSVTATDLGQTFTATKTGVLKDIQVAADGAPIAGIATLNIYAGSGSGGSLLHTQAVDFAGIDTVIALNNYSFHTITLDSTVNISSGSTYTFLFTSTFDPCCARGKSLDLAYQVSGGGYANGDLYSDDNGGIVGGADMVFKVTQADAVANNAPVLTNLNGDTVAWAGVGNTVNLDLGTNASVSDVELDALNGGNGDYSGASLTLQRVGTAITSDVFGFDTSGALFSASGANLQSGGLTFASFTNASGVLNISFNSSATTASKALVQDVLQRIQYRNDTPAADAALRFSFSDGTASTTADVTATSDSIYVTITTDTAMINLSNGVSFSEAVAIALADTTGSQTLILSSAFNSSMTLAGNLTIAESLAIDANAASAGFIVAGSTITLGSGFTLSLTHGNLLQITSTINGAGNLSKSGAGSLKLTGTNSSRTGSTSVLGGILDIADDNNLDGANTGALTLDGGTLAMLVTGGSTGNPVIKTINNPITLGAAGGSFDPTGGGGRNIINLSGVISGSGTLTKNGASVLMLSGNNSYTGQTLITNGGVLLNHNNGLGSTSGSATVNAGSALRIGAGVVSPESLFLNGTGRNIDATEYGAIGADAYSLGTSIVSGNIVLSTGTNISVGSGNYLILSGIVSGTGTLTKTDMGSLTLAGINTYTGSTSASEGTLVLNNGAAMADGTGVSIASGAGVRLGASETIGSLSGAGNMDMNSADLTVNQTGDSSFSGNIIGSGSNLTKSGSSKLTLSGTNTYTGVTTISNGSLSLTGALSGTTGATIGSGGTLEGTGSVFATSSTNTLTVQSGGILSPGVSGPGTITINGNLSIASGGSLTAQITGTVLGSGYDSVTVNGAVDVSSATLNVNHSYTPGLGDSYRLLVNDGVDSITGNFSGLPQGGTVTAAGNSTVLTAYYAATDGGGYSGGNEFMLVAPADITPPTVSSVSVPANATYVSGQNLDFNINFDENITVNTAGGTPQLALTIGATTRQATYQSGSGSSSLLFRYTIQSGESDSDGITIGSLAGNGGTLRDGAGNNANLMLNSVGSTTSVLVDGRTAQIITFVNPGAQNFSTSPTLTASSDSGLSPTFTSSTTGVCTVTTGGALTFVSTGTCTINAVQAGNGSYLPAPQVSRSFSVNAVVADAPSIGTATAGDTQASVSFSAPTSNGGAAITGYTVTSSPGGLTGAGVGSPITVTGLTNGVAYTFTVTATNAAGVGSASGTSNSIIPAATQTITFANPGAQNFGTTPTLTATASSSLTPTFTSSTTGVCTITTGGTVTFVAAGTCTIDANQVGNSSYLAASTVSRSFTVNAVAPGVPTAAIATSGDTQASVAFSAPAFSGGAAITGYTVTTNPGGLTGTGPASPITVTGLTNGTAYTFTITATNVAGTGSSSVASSAITPAAAQTITFVNPGVQNFGTTPTLTATANSGLTPNFTSSTAPVCTVTGGGTLTFVSTGSCTINVNQAGSAAFLPATQVSQTFAVNAVVAGTPTMGSAVAGDAQATISFTASASNGGVAITGYTVTSAPGGLTASGAGSPLTVTGLTNGTAYTFSVTSTNSAGISPASAVSNSITPIAAQTITFANPGAQSVGTSPALMATASSNLALSFTSSTTAVCTVTTGGVLTLVTTGSCTINANQAGSAAFLPATQVSQTFSVNAVAADAPTIGTAVAGDTQATVAFTPPTNGGSSAITGYSATSLPGGLTASGTASPLTVTGLTNGTAYTFSVTATSAVGISSASAASNSVTPNGAPVITSTPLLSVDEGVNYSYTFTATDSVGDVLTFSAPTLPVWLSFNAATGSITGVASRDNVGNHAVSLTVTDAAGLFEIQSFTLVVNEVNSVPVANSDNVSVDEDSSVSFSFSGTDAENDELSFEVVTQPLSGTLDKHGSVWLYTPNADFNGDDSVSFIAKDATLSSAPALVSIKVNAINDAPKAVDDSFNQALSADNRYLLSVLDNDTDVDGDTLTIDGAAADVGSVQIVNSQLTYQAPSQYVGPVALKYTLSDGNKGRSNAKVSLMIGGDSSVDAPVITVPADITVNATGLFTKLKLGIATAVDKDGKKLAVSLVNTKQLFAPGEHLAYWQATDSQGRSAIKSQRVLVNPLISISRDQVVAEGDKAKITAYLNGVSPQYPVSVSFTVSGSADSNDHDLVDGVIIIESGLSASISVNLLDDGVAEADETVIVTLDAGVNLSSQNSMKLLITEMNIAPQASIKVTQASEQRTQVSKLEGKVYIKAISQDVNLQDSFTELWSTGDIVLETDEQGQYFDPSLMVAGLYPISLTVTDDGTPQLSTKVQLSLLIKDSLPILAGNDSDGDLIPDNQEGFGDSDTDGIPDYLDAIGECNVLQEVGNEQSQFLAESQAGVCLRLGGAAQLNGSEGMKVAVSALLSDTQATNIGGIYDFEATGLPRFGDSYSFSLPQSLPVPANAVYRKLNLTSGWKDFVLNDKNTVASSAGDLGLCPPPGSVLWETGLTEGHWCVQLTIEDGGPNDDDGIANGTIVDPGGVAVVLNGNSLPLAVADSVTVSVNQSVDVDVLANDTDTDGDSLTVKQVNSQFGSAVILSNQQISYTPAFDFIGNDVLVYSISDGKGGTASSELTVTIIDNRAPVAVDDVASTNDRTSILLNVLANDTDIDGDSLTLVSGTALQGAVSVESNQLRYTPKPGFEGVDSVSYIINDGAGGEATGQVLVTIKAYQDVVIDNQSGGGSLSLYGLALLVFGGLLRRAKWLAVSGVLLFGVITQANAAEANTWYVDGFVGQAYADSKIHNWQSPNDSVITDVDDSDTAFGMNVGYQWNTFLAVELGYSDFGNGSAQLKGSTLTPEAYHQELKSVTPILADGITLGMRFTLMEHEDWRIEVPVGLFMWDADIVSDMGNSSLTTGMSGTDWYAGMQFSYQMTESWSLGIGYQYIDLDPNDILTGKLSLRYSF